MARWLHKTLHNLTDCTSDWPHDRKSCPLSPMFAYMVLPFIGRALMNYLELGLKRLQKRLFYLRGHEGDPRAQPPDCGLKRLADPNGQPWCHRSPL